MRPIKTMFICAICLIWVLPLIFFNRTPRAISLIDNRQLTDFPFGRDSEQASLEKRLQQLEAYASDRIGFRDRMVEQYTRLHQAVFADLVHPSYMLGREGYVFFKRTANVEFSDYHEAFAEMVIEADRYLKERGIPFIFVLNPEKSSVLPEKMPEGMNFSNDWVTRFLEILEQHQVSVVDNTETLRDRTMRGEAVFNRQYDAGHWNDLGAFYGVNAILKKMQQSFPEVRSNQKKDFSITQVRNRTLPVSSFAIDEYAPVFTPLEQPVVETQLYGDVPLHPNFRFFYASRNPEAVSPRTLVFQGSYLNGRGVKFLANALHEYIAVHDYQNILELDYFVDRFVPECVIFEVAEYTFADAYFDFEAMQSLEWAD